MKVIMWRAARSKRDEAGRIPHKTSCVGLTWCFRIRWTVCPIKQTVLRICRHSYPVFYRLMLQELVESVKKLTPGKATDPEEVSGRVNITPLQVTMYSCRYFIFYFFDKWLIQIQCVFHYSLFSCPAAGRSLTVSPAQIFMSRSAHTLITPAYLAWVSLRTCLACTVLFIYKLSEIISLKVNY